MNNRHLILATLLIATSSTVWAQEGNNLAATEQPGSNGVYNITHHSGLPPAAVTSTASVQAQPVRANADPKPFNSAEETARTHVTQR